VFWTYKYLSRWPQRTGVYEDVAENTFDVAFDDVVTDVDPTDYDVDPVDCDDGTMKKTTKSGKTVTTKNDQDVNFMIMFLI